MRSDPADFMQYSDSAGLPKLRQAIARHLIASRGIYCDPDDIIVVQGAQQGLDLLSRVLLDPGDLVLMEDPGYRGAKVVFRAYGATVIGLPVDAHGVIVPRQDELPRRPKLLYCTPSHQFPTGAVLTASRRLELEDLAQHEGFFICEDDYDSEFRFRVKPIPALKGMDDADVVIHLGTFSKALFPSLRLGYILAPRRLVAPLKAMKACADLQSPTLDQATLALFISEGHYVRHLIRMRRLYARRREQIVAAIDKHFGARAKITGDEAGLHIAVEFNVDLLDHEIAEIAERAGVLVTPMSNYFVNESPERMCSSCLLGYTSISESDIDRGIQRLAAVLVPAHVAERKLLRGITREHQIS